MNRRDQLTLARRLQFALSSTKTGRVTLVMESTGREVHVTAGTVQRVIDNLRFPQVEAE